MNESSLGFASRSDNRFSNWRTRILPVALVGLLLALPADSASAQSAARLQPLLNDTVAQLKLVYRSDADELHRRYEQVSKALAAWRAAERTEENNRRLEAWLRAAIRSSMPGSQQPLPPAPKFEDLPEPIPARPLSERSLIPAASAVESPAAIKPRATTGPTFTQPRAPRPAGATKVDANKPIADESTMAGGQPADKREQTAPDSQPPIDELPDIGALLESEEALDLGELPDAQPLPDIEVDPALIEALGDPFVDDP